MAKRKPEEDEMELDNEFNNENFAPKAKFTRYDEPKQVTLEDYGITYKFEHNVNPSWWNNYYMVEGFYHYYKNNSHEGTLHVQKAICFWPEKTKFAVNISKFSCETPMIENNELVYKGVDTSDSFEFKNLEDAPNLVLSNPELKDFVEKTLSKEV